MSKVKIKKNKATADRLRDTARSTIATIEQLASHLALIGQADLLTPAAARAMCAQLDDVVTGLLHEDDVCPDCGMDKPDDQDFCDACEHEGDMTAAHYGGNDER